MSNRQFKTILSQSKYVLFDYGNVEGQLPNIDKQLAGVCRFGGVFYIKQRNSEAWIPLMADQLLINIVYNVDNIDSLYWWVNQYGGQEINVDFIPTKGEKNNLFIWKHNQQKYIDCSFFRTIDGGQNYGKINMPYEHIDENTIIADFNGFTTYNNTEALQFYISCK